RVQHSWAFHQLGSFIEYKARLAGVPVVCVDPRNTSRTRPACGHVSKANYAGTVLLRRVRLCWAG
ncbi:MAG: transposase, partial [Armatimonadota bacterium]